MGLIRHPHIVAPVVPTRFLTHARDMSEETMVLRARGLHISLGRHRHRQRILRDLNFEIPAGRITGLLGPSGSGKTTLMRAIVGVQRFEGELKVLGHTAGATILRGHIGYVTQSAAVYPDLSIRRNLEYFHAIAGTGRDPAEIMAELEIGELADHRVADLSGGQRSRASLGCALVGEPKLLVMDEPTVGLDPLTRIALWEQFHKLSRQGTSLILSSHVLDEAARCDHLLLLREGHIIWRGSPTQLLEETETSNFDEAFLVIISRKGEPA